MKCMRIMWTVFVTFPEVAEKVGKKAEYACTWARALADHLRYRDDIRLAIVSVANGNEVQKHTVDNIDFYFLPNEKAMKSNGGGIQSRVYWKHVIEDFQPDLIHIHGSESMVPYELIKMNLNVPLYLTLQGILSNYYKDYTAGISYDEIKKNITIRDIIRRSGIIGDQRKAKMRSKTEQEMIRGVHYLGGRTTWDRVSSLAIHPTAKYLTAPEMIRPEFYESDRWDIDSIERHRLFMHQGFKPIKGLHILLEAMFYLKKKYPDLQLYMSGTNVMKKETLKDKLLQTGYVKFLFKKIAEYQLEDCIHFTGILDAKEIVSELKKSHVMVLPSSIENSPNSLCEAQLVGIPTVSSYVGGIPEMLRDGVDGYLYAFNEPLMLAEYISQVFESDQIAERFSTSSYQRIREKQGSEYVVEKTIKNYRYIIDDWKVRRGNQ